MAAGSAGYTTLHPRAEVPRRPGRHGRVFAGHFGGRARYTGRTQVRDLRRQRRSGRMKRILVGIKRVVDYNVRIRVKPDGSGVITDGVKMSINPFDEIALEEALRIKERGAAEEIVVATVGPADCQQQLRTALAMGADRALHVQADGIIEPLVAARTLLKLVEREQPFLVILGKQAIDD